MTGRITSGSPAASALRRVPVPPAEMTADTSGNTRAKGTKPKYRMFEVRCTPAGADLVTSTL